MLYHEMPANKRQIALTAGFVGYVQNKMKQFTHNEAIAFLNNQYWHDSVLHEIRIIRTNSVDQTIILLDLITREDGMESNRCTLTFKDCYYIGT